MNFENPNLGYKSEKIKVKPKGLKEKVAKNIRKIVLAGGIGVGAIGGAAYIGHDRYTDYTDAGSFNSAFKKARADKKSGFKWKDKYFTTDLVDKEMSDNYWESIIFLEEYYRSKEFKSKYNKSDKEIEEIISNLKKPIYLSLTHQKGDKYADDGFFDDKKNQIFIYGIKNENNRTTAAHELSHKANRKKDLIENKKFKEIFGVDLILAKENPNFLMDYKEDADGMFDYLSSTTEIDARQNSTRFYLYKNFPGYTADTKFTPEHYDFLKENYQKLPFGIRQLLDFWTTKEAFISCMNKF